MLFWCCAFFAPLPGLTRYVESWNGCIYSISEPMEKFIWLLFSGFWCWWWCFVVYFFLYIFWTKMLYFFLFQYYVFCIWFRLYLLIAKHKRLIWKVKMNMNTQKRKNRNKLMDESERMMMHFLYIQHMNVSSRYMNISFRYINISEGSRILRIWNPRNSKMKERTNEWTKY